MRTLLFLVLLVISSAAYAQISAVTQDGRFVILNEDGTWRYADVPAEPKKEEKKKKKKGSGASFSCDEVVGSYTDEVSGEEVTGLLQGFVKASDPQYVQASELFKRPGGIVAWTLKVSAIQGCTDQIPAIDIKFVDGSTMKLKVENDFVCDNVLSFFLGKKLGTKNELKKLGSGEIESVTVPTRDGPKEVTFFENHAAAIFRTFQCIGDK